MEERPPEDVPPPAGGAEDAARSVAEALGDAAQAIIGALPPNVAGPPMAGAAKSAQQWVRTCGGTVPLKPFGQVRLDAKWRGARSARH